MDAGSPHLDAYTAVHDRVVALVTAGEVAPERAVPACPDWTVAQVVGHLAALAEDWVDGRLDGYGSQEWTQHQVARFEGRPIGEAVTAWDAALERFADLTESPMGGTPAMWAFGDAVVHEADLRAVATPRSRVPDDAVALGLKAAVARWRGVLGAAGVPPLRIVARDAREWWVGEPDDSAGTVTTTSYELFRALFGRRARTQVEAWEWSGDPAPYLDAGLPEPFSWAARPLED